jgi:hypothetical protein
LIEPQETDRGGALSGISANGARHSCRFNVEHGSVFDDFWSSAVEAA